MTETNEPETSQQSENFHFFSSIADDVWHPLDAPAAYEWWYFDALSDDGRDALVVIFLDNFIFSPRYNALQSERLKAQSLGKSKNKNPKSEIERFPAVVFCFYRDGKLLYRGINELSTDKFIARSDFPACQIGESSFHFEATPYGIRYILDVNVNLRGNKKLSAAMEWLIVERDFLPNVKHEALSDAHSWNMACPRSDVTGKITVVEENADQAELIQFRGTGYHDHNQDSRWLPTVVEEWQWGRAHFADMTAIFYRYLEINSNQPVTKLFLIKDYKLSVFSAEYSQSSKVRSTFNVKYPKQINFQAGNRITLSVEQNKVIDASFFYLRFLSEFKLDAGDGKLHETVGITEQLSPRSLRWRWLDWLVNMRIGKEGRGAFLP